MISIPLDKAKLLHRAITQVEETLQRLSSGYAAAKQATLDSPHVMKSKREVAGIEASYLANALAGNIQEREFWLRTLRGLRMPDAPERVALGCVVGVGPPGGAIEGLYFILPVCGGMEIPVDVATGVVRVITPGTPIGKSLIGKSVGEEIEYRIGAGQPASVRLLV
jgi:transcription elongation GreA/GreB family factor